MRFIHSLFCLLLIALGTSGCEWTGGRENRVALVVGSREFSVQDIKKEMEILRQGMEVLESERERFNTRMVEQIIDHQLIMEYAEEEGISVNENEIQAAVKALRGQYSQKEFEQALLRGYSDLEQWKVRLKEQLLVGKVLERVTRQILPPGYPEIKAYFEANPHEFKSPPMVRFRQIVTRTKGDAQALRKRLENGSDMGALARDHSIAPEAAQGGEVGWIAQGQLDESMDRVLFSLPVDQISQVVQTPYGYHIFQILAARPGGVKELPAVISEIETKLLNEKRQTFCHRWLKDLRDHYEVRINKALLKTL
jgi:parvulin-like peptidyl-prolyl isomerase